MSITLLVGIFYFTLGNVPPRWRSKLTSINLLAVVKHKFVVEYGMDLVLKPIIGDVMLLVSIGGIIYTI